MLRVVLVVALAAALLAVAMPAVEHARIQYSNDRVATEIERLDAVMDRLAAENDPPPPGMAGARRVVTLRLPDPSFGSAGVEYLRVDGTRPQHVRWRVHGGTEQVRPLTGVDIDGVATVEANGRQRLRLHHQHDGTVRVETIQSVNASVRSPTSMVVLPPWESFQPIRDVSQYGYDLYAR